MDIIKNRSYYKSELALFYGIDRKTLRKIIHSAPGLLKRLKDNGYTKSLRKLWPIHVAIIHEYVSENAFLLP